MTSRFRLTVHVLKPPDELIKFVQPVDGDVTFSLVWKLAQDRYHQNYSAGRKNDYYWKGLRDENGADIDMRDTVVDVFGPILDPNRHIVQVNQQPVYRDDTAPLDSHLRPAFPPPTPAQRQQINKRRSEFERYGDTLDTLDPNQPVESHEHLPAPARKDSDGFAIPTKINRPSATHAPASPTVSQDTYEHQLVETQRRPSSELGSPVSRAPPSPLLETPPASSTASSQYSSLAAVPSAQKLRTRSQTPVDQESEASVTEVVDPISDDSQPRLSILAVKTPTQAKPSSFKKKMSLSDDRRASLVGRDLASTPSSSTPASAPRVTWSSSDHAKVVEGLAKGLTIHAIQTTYFPTRTNESVRSKVRKVRKDDAGMIAQRKAQLSANSLWTEDEELQFVGSLPFDKKNPQATAGPDATQMRSRG